VDNQKRGKEGKKKRREGEKRFNDKYTIIKGV
jgi:hypothetical protein